MKTRLSNQWKILVALLALLFASRLLMTAAQAFLQFYASASWHDSARADTIREYGRPLLILLSVLKAASVCAIPLVTGIAYAGGQLRLRYALLILPLIFLVPLLWDSVLWTSIMGSLNSIQYPEGAEPVTLALKRLTGPTFGYSSWLYADLALGLIAGLSIGALARRAPKAQGAHRARLLRNVFIAALLLLALTTVLCVSGVLAPAAAALVERVRAAEQDPRSPWLISEYIIQFFHGATPFLRMFFVYVRPMLVWFCLIMTADAALLCARRVTFRQALAASGAALLCLTVCLLATPTRDVYFGLLSSAPVFAQKLATLPLFIVPGAFLLGAGALLRRLSGNAPPEGAPEKGADPA